MSKHPQKSNVPEAPQTHPDDDKIFVSRQWLSRRWSISQPTIIRMEERGELTPVCLGARLVRYRRAEIEALEGKSNG